MRVEVDLWQTTGINAAEKVGQVLRPAWLLGCANSITSGILSACKDGKTQTNRGEKGNRQKHDPEQEVLKARSFIRCKYS